MCRLGCRCSSSCRYIFGTSNVPPSHAMQRTKAELVPHLLHIAITATGGWVSGGYGKASIVFHRRTANAILGRRSKNNRGDGRFPDRIQWLAGGELREFREFGKVSGCCQVISFMKLSQPVGTFCKLSRWRMSLCSSAILSSIGICYICMSTFPGSAQSGR